MVTIGETYVERAEKAILETAILAQLRLHGPMPRDELVRSVLGSAKFPKEVNEGFVRDCLARVEKDEHVKRSGESYEVTRDGLDDLSKIEDSLGQVARSGKLAPEDESPNVGPPAGP